MEKQITCHQPTKYSETQNTLVNDAGKARNASSRYYGTHWKKCATYWLKWRFVEFKEWGGNISKEVYYMNSSQSSLLTMKLVCQTGSVKVQFFPLTNWKYLSWVYFFIAAWKSLWCTDQQGPSGSIYAFIQPDTSSLAKQAVISASACSCPQAKLSQVNCCCHISKEERWDPTETAVKERHACSHLPIPPPPPYCFFTSPSPLAKVNFPDYFLGVYPLLPCTREGCYCWSKEERLRPDPAHLQRLDYP